MSEKTRKKLPVVFVAVLIAAVVVVGVWLLRSKWASDDEPGASGSTQAAVTAEQVESIAGRWRRPDGGYIIDILGLDAAGNLNVAYYNPRPINVSQAHVVQSPKGLHVFVELWDTNYPGATYRLDYDSENDMLSGIYHQPAVNQTFDVVFVREQ